MDVLSSYRSDQHNRPLQGNICIIPGTHSYQSVYSTLLRSPQPSSKISKASFRGKVEGERLSKFTAGVLPMGKHSSLSSGGTNLIAGILNSIELRNQRI